MNIVHLSYASSKTKYCTTRVLHHILYPLIKYIYIYIKKPHKQKFKNGSTETSCTSPQGCQRRETKWKMYGGERTRQNATNVQPREQYEGNCVQQQKRLTHSPERIALDKRTLIVIHSPESMNVMALDKRTLIAIHGQQTVVCNYSSLSRLWQTTDSMPTCSRK